jgi:hypothetical protein
MRDPSRAVGLGLVFAFFAFVVVSFYFPSRRLLFPNSDFEFGDLSYWQAVGPAFRNQPTFGDNPYYREIGSARPVGNFWAGSGEAHHSAGERAGAMQGDTPVGRLVSDPFRITHRRISFLIGAGDGSDKEGVALQVDGEEVLFEPGRASALYGDGMRRRSWDVSPWYGKIARLVVIDEATGSWGHINVDDFRWS